MPRKLMLPQNDPQEKRQRQQYLKKMRKLYEYSLSYDKEIDVIKKLPRQEQVGLVYNLRLIANLLPLVYSLPSLLFNHLKGKYRRYPYPDYQDYFFFKNSSNSDPEFLQNFNNDIYFGLQRVAGVNPVVIEGITPENPLPDTFQVSHIVPQLTHQTYEDALQEKRLYLTNYSCLEIIANHLATEDGYQKYVTNPIALFYRQDNGLLRPLAIQLYATKATDSQKNPIYTPADGQYWLMAKIYFQAAEATHQELWTHATRIHYLMESIIMATYRNFARNHPLFALLEPHLRYTLFVNYHPLFKPDEKGNIPTFGKMFACTNDALVEFMGMGMRKYNFKEMAFPKDIKNRNIEDEKLYYPYRDDGQLVWDAIHNFVEEYVKLYYLSNQDIQEDDELQNWAKEIGADSEKKHSMIPDFPNQLNTLNELVEILENIIFIATAHHNCIHFTQHQYAGCVPNMPYSVYSPPDPTFQNFPFKKDLMKLFPPFSKAFYQTWIFYLTNFKVDCLGEYNLNQFDSPAQKIIKTFQWKLEAISLEIKIRNSQRQFPYPFMDPQNIPNSVSI